MTAMQYENSAIPFKTWNNHQVLFEEQLQNEPWLRDFIEAFPHCFEYDQKLYLWIFYPYGIKD